MLSVVMPAHNAEKYLDQAIQSILHQTFTEFEFIIVNDSSTDQTQDIIDHYASIDSRITSVRCHAQNVSGARNTGIALAKGEYIALMDADDIALPLRLQTQMSAAQQHPDVVVWGCYMQYITPEGISMGTMKLGPTSHQAFYRLDRTQSLIDLYGTVAMFRRDIYDKVGSFDNRVEPAEDSEMWDRMAEFGPAIVIPEILQLYRQHSSSISATKVTVENHWQSFIKVRHQAKLDNYCLTVEEWATRLETQSRYIKVGQIMRGHSQRFGRKSRISFARQNYFAALTYALFTVLSHPVRFVT